jgi:hypothetical protein
MLELGVMGLLLLPYGLRAEKLVHISEIKPEESGLKCNCVCPSCGERLQAKLPRTKKDFTPRFAHHHSECQYATETALHMKAKEIIEEAKYIVVPEVIAWYSVFFKDISPVKQIYFDSVALERRVGNIIPDIIAYINGKQLMIEITVTHRINDIKREKIKKLGISALEIDLSGIDYLDPEQLQYEVLSGINCKRWIYNIVIEKEKEKLKKQYLQTPKHEIIENITDMKVPGENVFSCDRKDWQTCIFSYICEKNTGNVINVGYVIDIVKAFFSPHIIDKDNMFQPIYSYLKILQSMGFLSKYQERPERFIVSTHAKNLLP